MASSLVFQVRRCEPELIGPAKPTRREFKALSDLDDQDCFRHHLASLHFFAHEPNMEGRDPVTVIRKAIAEGLVYYYPLAGRLRELPEGKLVLECTGEGVLFVEADADVRLEQFGEDPKPPYPCAEELIHNVEGSDAILHSPLVLIQVTRLKCGGFVFAVRYNHTVMDGYGAMQCMIALAEMARGADAPTVRPVWERERLAARVPPQVTHSHLNLDMMGSAPFSPDDNVVLRSFFFGPRDLAVLRKTLPPQLRRSTRFEVVTACVWRSRTVALGTSPDEQASVVFTFNARGKCHPPLPAGYYGNAFTPVVVACTAGEICGRPLANALLLLRKAKATVTGGYLQSLVDLASLAGGRLEAPIPHFTVSDIKDMGLEGIDFGWGKAAVAGPPFTSVLTGCFQYRYLNSKGEDGIMVTLRLPSPVMERFAAEIKSVISEVSDNRTTATSRILSAL